MNLIKVSLLFEILFLFILKPGDCLSNSLDTTDKQKPSQTILEGDGKTSVTGDGDSGDTDLEADDKATVAPVSIPTPRPATEDTATKPQTTFNTRDKLRTDLLHRYPGQYVHPVKNHSMPVTVYLGMALIHLDLEEHSSVLEVDGWMRLNWTDEYLVWDPKDYGELKQIHFGSDEIWKPDIQLYNNADSANLQHFGTTHFLVQHTGVVLWVPPAKFRAFCKIDLRLWPQDTQECKLKFGSWTSHGDEIGLQLFHGMPIVDKLNFYTANKEWQVETHTASQNNNKYKGIPEDYPDVTLNFTLRRTSPSYRAAVILPCLVTMMLVVSSFLLPPSAGEKVTLNSMCLLVSCVYLLYFQSALPPMSDHIPLIVLFYSNTALLVGIALVLNVTCISMARERRYSSPPRFLRNLFSGFLGRILCLGSYYHQVSETHQRLVLELDNVSMNDCPESEQAARELNGRSQETNSVMRDWRLVAAGIERFFFLVYALAFALVSSVYL